MLDHALTDIHDSYFNSITQILILTIDRPVSILLWKCAVLSAWNFEPINQKSGSAQCANSLYFSKWQSEGIKQSQVLHIKGTVFVQIPGVALHLFLPIQMNVCGSGKTANGGQAAGLLAMMMWDTNPVNIGERSVLQCKRSVPLLNCCHNLGILSSVCSPGLCISREIT